MQAIKRRQGKIDSPCHIFGNLQIRLLNLLASCEFEVERKIFTRLTHIEFHRAEIAPNCLDYWDSLNLHDSENIRHRKFSRNRVNSRQTPTGLEG